MSYSLKKIYEFKSTFSDKNVDLKSIKSLNEEIQLLDTLQIKTIALPNFGTFDLNTVQIGIIACLNEFYFGNKQLVQNIINRLYNEDIYNQRSQISLAASLDYSLKNINRLTESNKLTAGKAIKFLDLCISHEILDKNYNIINGLKGNEIPTQEMGYLFELFTNHSISDKGYEVSNKEKHILSLCKHKSVKYVTSILNVIYLYKTTDELESYFDDNIDFIAERSKLLYDSNFNNTEEFDIDNLIKNNLKSLSFEFQIGGSYKDNPIDLVVRHDGYVVSMLDLKSHHGKENTTVDISSSKGAANTQINKIMSKQDIIKDFSIGILRLAYTFSRENIDINQFECIYSNYNNPISGHDAMIKRIPLTKNNRNAPVTHTEYDENYDIKKEYYGNYKMISGEYLTSNKESNNKPIMSNFKSIEVDFKRKSEEDRRIMTKAFLLKSLNLNHSSTGFSHVKKTWWHRLNEEEKNSVLEDIKNIFQSYSNDSEVKNDDKRSLIDRYVDLLHFNKNISILDDFCRKLIMYIDNNAYYDPITTRNHPTSKLIDSTLYKQFSIEDLLLIKSKVEKEATVNKEKTNTISAIDKSIDVKQIQNKFSITDSKMLQDTYKKYQTILKFLPGHKTGMPEPSKSRITSIFNSDNVDDKTLSGYLIDLIIDNREVNEQLSNYIGRSKVYNAIKNKLNDKLNDKKSLDKNSFDRGRGKLLREVYHDLFREDQYTL